MAEGYMYNDSALFLTGAMALSQSAYVSWGAATNDNTTVGIRQNEQGTLEFKDNATGSWTEFGSTLDDTTLGDSSSDIITINGQLTASQGMLIADDDKLYFGSDDDASIQYATSAAELQLSGAQGGIDIQMPIPVADALTISSDGTAYMTFDTTASEQVIAMNKEVDLIEGAIIRDDKQIIFGTDDDAWIRYDTNGGTNQLQISGSAAGIDIQPPINVADALTITSNTVTMVTFDTRNDAHKVKFGNAAGSGDANPEILIESENPDDPGGGVSNAGSITTRIAKVNGEIVTTILVDIDGLVNDGAASDVIGDTGEAAAYLTQLTEAKNGVIYKAEMACIEEPTVGTADIDLVSSSASLAEGATASAGADFTSIIAPGAAYDAGTCCYTASGADLIDVTEANSYLYLVHGGSGASGAGEYGAGKFIIKLYGASF